MFRKTVLSLTTLLGLGVALIPSLANARDGFSSSQFQIHRPGGWQMLNPQPLPPRQVSTIRPGSWQMLNPQPLPPRWR